MSRMGITEVLGRASAKRPWAVLVAWLVAIVVGGVFAFGIGDVLHGEFTGPGDFESDRANVLLEERLRGPDLAREFVIVRSPEATVDDERYRAFVDGLLVELRALEGTVEVATSFYETGIEELVSPDRQTTILPVTLAGEEPEAANIVGPVVRTVHEADGRDGFTVLTVGLGSVTHTFLEKSERDALRGEAVGIPIALVVLVLVFGAVVAAALPILIGIAAIVVAIGAVALVGRFYEVNFLAINMITMIGLAVGVDYTLFIVHRFREERRRGLELREAIARASATSGRAVVFSGAAVIVGLMGLLIIPSNVYRSAALGATAVALVAVAAALTLLPAVLSLLGDRINAIRIPFLQRGSKADVGDGFFGRVASFVMRNATICLVVSVSLLILAAMPYFTIETGLAGVSSLPEGSDSRRAFELLQGDFDAGLTAPVEIVVDAPDVGAPQVQVGIGSLLTAIESDEHFRAASVETNGERDLALVSALLTVDPDTSAAHDAVARLRDEHIPAAFAGVDAEVLVTGATAETGDMFDMISRYTPYVFAFVLGLSFILLLLMFRSIVVPIKALIMNLLSVGATYGLLVLVFQHGVGNELLGFQQSETIEAWLPLFLFAFLFGLSMDYHVFLLSRIRERWEQTGDNQGSVAFGISSTAGLITGAALIMVAIFSGFAMGDLVALQQSGFGLAVAILLDATIIRTVVVPASMQLLGDWNWYLPSWLKWLPVLAAEGPGRSVERAPSRPVRGISTRPALDFPLWRPLP